MKKIHLIIALVFITWTSMGIPRVHAQDNLQEYTAANDVTYRVGDVIKTNKGSAPDGTFRYIFLGTSNLMDEEEDSITDAEADLKTMTLKEIKKVTPAFKNHPEVVFIVESDNLMVYSLRIDKALEADEIITPKTKSTYSAGRKPYNNRCPTNKKPPVSVADELLKLKSLQNSGALKPWEYNQIKEKLLQEGAGSMSVADELIKLQPLRNNGALKPWEYNEQKEKLLKNGAGPVSVADELIKLQILREKGILKPWEFNEQKEKLLKN